MDFRSSRELADDAVIPKDRVEWYLEQYLPHPQDGDDLRASPARCTDLSGLPPALIICGGFDPLRDDARNYGERLAEAGVDVTLHEYPGQIHAFMMLTRAIPEGLRATREVADYIRRQFTGEPGHLTDPA